MAPGRLQRPTVDVDFTLRRVFGMTSFRPLQREVIVAAIEGHDVFLQAATSFGKSLCFQLPAVISHGITVVISPLLALMHNQVSIAKSLGIAVEVISSNVPPSERQRIITDLKCGHPYTRLLYVTPELCATDHFRKVLTTIHRQGQLTRVAVDEAHCISEWGHDFRTSYKELSWLKRTLILPSVPITVLTATATTRVRDDILKCLGLEPPNPLGREHSKTKFFFTSTSRPNLHYEVRYFSESSPKSPDGNDLFHALTGWLKGIAERRAIRLKALHEDTPATDLRPISGIIYVGTRNLANSLAKELRDRSIKAEAYHAGLDSSEREQIQTEFIDPPKPSSLEEGIKYTFNIIVATTAFGMGIDAPHVRFVLHYGLPRGFEAFVQESGRAGRDGKAAASVIFYTREECQRVLYRISCDIVRDANRQSHGSGSSSSSSSAQGQARTESFKQVVQLCETTNRCRHRLVSDYFGDTDPPVCDFACDHCKEGAHNLRRRMEKGLANDEDAFTFTQRERAAGLNDYD